MHRQHRRRDLVCERVFTLSDEINREAIEAKLENGVLRLKLPKVEVAKARRIAIAAG